MKYAGSAPHPARCPQRLKQFDAAIDWLEGKKVNDGTFDCIFGYLEGGGVQRHQRRFPKTARPWT